MALEILAEPAQVFGDHHGPSEYLYAIVERLPRRWRPPAIGLGPAPVIARSLRGLVLITSAIDAVPRPTPKTQARAGDVAVVPTGPWPPMSFSPRLPIPGSAGTSDRLARAG